MSPADVRAVGVASRWTTLTMDLSHARPTRGAEECAIVDETMSREAAASWDQDPKVRRTYCTPNCTIGSADDGSLESLGKSIR